MSSITNFSETCMHAFTNAVYMHPKRYCDSGISIRPTLLLQSQPHSTFSFTSAPFIRMVHPQMASMILRSAHITTTRSTLSKSTAGRYLQSSKHLQSTCLGLGLGLPCPCLYPHPTQRRVSSTGEGPMRCTSRPYQGLCHSYPTLAPPTRPKQPCQVQPQHTLREVSPSREAETRARRRCRYR